MTGIKFFDFDYLNNSNNNTVTVSSGDVSKEFMFDGSIDTRWLSYLEGDDHTTSTIEIEFASSKNVDTVFLQKSNAKTYELEYWTGSAWATPAGLVESESEAGGDVLFTFTSLSTTKILVSITETLIADAEKYVTNLMAFSTIGQFTGYPNIKPKIIMEQFDQKLISGKHHITDRGQSIEIILSFEKYVVDADLQLLEMLKQRKSEFFILLNGGNESQFTRLVEPYRLRDLYKVAISGGYPASYYKNLYGSGVDTEVTLVEVA